MNARRLWLTRSVKILSLIGMGFVAWPFIASLTGNDAEEDQRHAAWEIEIDVSTLNSGEFLNIDTWPGGPVSVYRRTAYEIASLNLQNTELADANSALSQQPATMTNATRSLLPEYFVFIPLDTRRRCQVRYIAPNKQPRPAIDWRGGFAEPCEGSLYDTAGHIYRNTGHAEQRNLRVPPYTRIGRNTLQLGIAR